MPAQSTKGALLQNLGIQLRIYQAEFWPALFADLPRRALDAGVEGAERQKAVVVGDPEDTDWWIPDAKVVSVHVPASRKLPSRCEGLLSG